MTTESSMSQQLPFVSSIADEVCRIAARFSSLSESVVSSVQSLSGMPEDVSQWIAAMNRYNVPHGKKNRAGLCVATVRSVKVYDLLSRRGEERCFSHPSDDRVVTWSDDEATEIQDFIDKAQILGWCIEWLEAFCLVADDIMDCSKTRRGQPCWYTLPHVRLKAINDAFLLESEIYKILSLTFGQKLSMSQRKYGGVDVATYATILDTFHNCTLLTCCGQAMDSFYSVEDVPDYTADDAEDDASRQFMDYHFNSNFTAEKYHAIVIYKTAMYTFHLPMSLALVYCGISDEIIHEQAKRLSMEMGAWFQIQDDYLDCFGDPMITGKIGTDIEDGKCSWLVVQALGRCDESQRLVLRRCYGRRHPDAVALVKSIYRDLQLESLFSNFEKDTAENIINMLRDVDPRIRPPFQAVIDKLYKRKV